MKITIYELLGMIKEGKAPKRFKYDSSEWLYDYESSAYWNDKGVEFENYMDDGLMKYLNDEVEIIEEPQEHKIPDKIFLNQTYGNCYIDIYSYKQVPFKREKLSPEEISIINKINEILDYLSKEE